MTRIVMGSINDPEQEAQANNQVRDEMDVENNDNDYKVEKLKKDRFSTCPSACALRSSPCSRQACPRSV
jgi:hypothetical protein